MRKGEVVAALVARRGNDEDTRVVEAADGIVGCLRPNIPTIGIIRYAHIDAVLPQRPNVVIAADDVRHRTAIRAENLHR